MSKKNIIPAQDERESIHFKPSNRLTSSCLYRLLSLVIACCFLTFVILQLPLSNTNKILICTGLFLLGLLLLIGTGPKLESTTHPPTEITVSLVGEETKIIPTDTEPLTAFDTLVQEALRSIPDEFLPYMENLAVLVEDEPDSATLQRAGVPPGYTLLGLYQGSPLTDYGHRYSLLPERITIYQGPIERRCHGDAERIRAQVRATVLHEVAHHFGIDHDDMPHWVK
jgi:predicted Zn-dependent protease with MMP-like domain